MPTDHFCQTCNKTFSTLDGVKSHARAKRHTANPHACMDCEVSFRSFNALQAHLNSPRHRPLDAYLDGLASDSDSDYPSEDEDAYSDGLALDSDNDYPSADEDAYCESCNRAFVDMSALNQHLAYSSLHDWCFECSRDFSSSTALAQHPNSLAHKDRTFKCPFCQGMFKSPSGIALHIESGCHKVNRHQVTAAVHAMKIVPNISIKRITGPVRPPTTVHTYIATEASFNGTAFVCFLCGRKFKTLPGLNSHLNSPAHDDDEFRCPKCKAEFKLISGFVQHVESGSCSLAKTTQVDKYFNDLTDQFSRLLKI